MASTPAALPSRPARLAGFCAALLTAAAFGFLFLLMLSLGLRRGVNHDEGQHLAAGAVLARDHLLPYRDFPYFHTPNLAFIYAFLFQFCPFLLLSARIFSVAAGWLTSLLLWIIVRRECAGKPWPVRWLLPAGAALLLAGDPVFRETFWRTWNHALATLLCLAAIAFALRPGKGWRWLAAGAFLGLAIGTRLTFAPLAAPFATAAFFQPGAENLRQRTRRLIDFCAGAAVSLLPSIILFAMAPAQFLFGNFTFNSRSNLLFREAYHDSRAAFSARVLYPFTTLLRNRQNLPVALLFALFVAVAIIRIGKTTPRRATACYWCSGSFPLR